MQSFKTILFAVAPPLLALALCIVWLCSYLVEVRAQRTFGDAYCSATLSRGDVVLFTLSPCPAFELFNIQRTLWPTSGSLTATIEKTAEGYDRRIRAAGFEYSTGSRRDPVRATSEPKPAFRHLPDGTVMWGPTRFRFCVIPAWMTLSLVVI